MKKIFAIFIYFLILEFLFFIIVLPDHHDIEMMGYDSFMYVDYPPQMFNLSYLTHWHLRHPIMAIFYLPAILIDYLLSAFDIHIRWILFVLNTNVYMTSSMILLYRLLIKLNVDHLISIFSVVLFCSFAHIILLSIQVESYVVSMFFLLLMLNMYIHGKKSVLIDNLLFAGLAGTTSTNGIKLFMVFAYQSKSIKEFLRRCFSSILFVVFLYYQVYIIFMNEFLYSINRQSMFSLITHWNIVGQV